MPSLTQTVMAAALAVVILGPLGGALSQSLGQVRGPLSPEVTADRRIVLRLQAPNRRQHHQRRPGVGQVADG